MLAAVLVLAGAAAGVWLTRADDAVPDPGTAAVTSLPGLPPASGEPGLPGLDGARPAPGTVAQVPGPFDDRFDLTGLALTRAAVTGELTVTDGAGELLDLQVLAGFYDASGTLVGQGRWDHHLDEETHQHGTGTGPRERFRVVVPAELRDTVVSAAVGVPVLVSE